MTNTTATWSVLSTLILSSVWMSASKSRLWLLAPVTELLEFGTTALKMSWLLTLFSNLKKKLTLWRSTPPVSIWLSASQTALGCSTFSKKSFRSSRNFLFLALVKSSSLTEGIFSLARTILAFKFITFILLSLPNASISKTTRTLWSASLG